MGSATPKEKNTQERKIIWTLSTGDSLTIQWEGGLEFQLENEKSYGLVCFVPLSFFSIWIVTPYEVLVLFFYEVWIFIGLCNFWRLL